MLQFGYSAFGSAYVVLEGRLPLHIIFNDYPQ